MRGALGGPRVLLRRLREVMAEPVSAQERLDKIVVLIAANMVAEVCSVYVLRVDETLELYATEGLKREAVHQTVMRGDSYLSPGVSAAVVEAFLHRGDETQLTPRERQVLQLVAEGLSTRAAAETLGVSKKTAESHRTRVMKKLGIHDTATLVRYAIRSGLIEP